MLKAKLLSLAKSFKSNRIFLWIYYLCIVRFIETDWMQCGCKILHLLRVFLGRKDEIGDGVNSACQAIAYFTILTLAFHVRLHFDSTLRLSRQRKLNLVNHAHHLCMQHYSFAKFIRAYIYIVVKRYVTSKSIVVVYRDTFCWMCASERTVSNSPSDERVLDADHLKERFCCLSSANNKKQNDSFLTSNSQITGCL